MPHVKAFAVQSATSPVAPFAVDRRTPRDHDVAIDIRYCGVCHSDLHQARNEWKGDSLYPMVPGHEITGIVTAVGRAVTAHKVGDRVGVGCFVDSCRVCANCLGGQEQYCLENPTLTYNDRERDGKTPTFGGYSGAIVVDERYVLRVPANLALDGAAPLLCAGITLYSPLRHWRVGPGSRVGIIGLGGLGHMGVKLAKAMGAEVTVFSHTPRKRSEALRLGADDYQVTSDPDTFDRLKKTFDLVINTVSVALDWNQYLTLLRLDGTLVLVGIPQDPVPMRAFDLLDSRRRLAGSSIGGISETQEMLDFCGQHGIVSDIEIVRIQGVNEAWARLLKGDVRYRFVIDMASLAEQAPVTGRVGVGESAN